MQVFRQIRLCALVVCIVFPFVAAGPAVGQGCPGDCDHDHSVVIGELITLVDIALGSTPPASCSAGDTSGDDKVSIGEIIAAVNAALVGCPAPVADPATAALAVARGLAQLPGLSDAISVAIDALGGPMPCELGGILESTCEDPGTGVFLTPVMAKHCRVSTLEGPIDYDGSVNITASGQCGGTLSLIGLRFAFAGDAVTEAMDESPLIDARFDETLTLQGFDIGPPPCHIKGGTATVDGPIVYHGAGQHQVRVQFDQLNANTHFLDFQGSCDPITVVTVADGPVRIDDTYGDGPFGLDATLHGFTLTIHRDTRQLEIEGAVESTCFGGTVPIKTVEPLDYPLDQPCFTGGVLAVGLPAGTVSVTIAADGGVQVDRNGDGMSDASYASCLDLPRDACE